jgi:hypothetical protein
MAEGTQLLRLKDEFQIVRRSFNIQDVLKGNTLVLDSSLILPELLTDQGTKILALPPRTGKSTVLSLVGEFAAGNQQLRNLPRNEVEFCPACLYIHYSN